MAHVLGRCGEAPCAVLVHDVRIPPSRNVLHDDDLRPIPLGQPLPKPEIVVVHIDREQIEIARNSELVEDAVDIAGRQKPLMQPDLFIGSDLVQQHTRPTMVQAQVPTVALRAVTCADLDVELRLHTNAVQHLQDTQLLRLVEELSVPMLGAILKALLQPSQHSCEAHKAALCFGVSPQCSELRVGRRQVSIRRAARARSVD
mmetsp:Transcript_48997/g.140833  ORF Transcript_48997/g.140833 Transcript_48997/m.140833 type:complete len:202 (+) Transcript_48997:278-883(+)